MRGMGLGDETTLLILKIAKKIVCLLFLALQLYSYVCTIEDMLYRQDNSMAMVVLLYINTHCILILKQLH